MKLCPGCNFLIADQEEICTFCSSGKGKVTSTSSAPTPRTVVGVLADPGVSAPRQVSTLERPELSAVDWDGIKVEPLRSLVSDKAPSPATDVKPRQDEYRSNVNYGRIAGLVALIGVLVIAGLGVVGRGPLGSKFTDMGISTVDNSVLAAGWQEFADYAGAFKGEMPAPHETVFEALSAKSPDYGGLVGIRSEGRGGSYLLAGSTDLGLGVDGVRSHNSEQGVRQLSERFAAARIIGDQTILRTRLLSYGYAADSVHVSGGSEGDAVETRTRLIVTPDNRIQIMVTAGPASAARELDDAHQRMVNAFRPA